MSTKGRKRHRTRTHQTHNEWKGERKCNCSPPKLVKEQLKSFNPQPLQSSTNGKDKDVRESGRWGVWTNLANGHELMVTLAISEA